MKDVTEFLSEIQLIGTKKRQAVNELLPTLLPATYLIKSLALDIQIDSDISHFVFLHPDRIWVCSYDKLFLADTKTGVVLQKYMCLTNSQNLFGQHTINGENELIYIDEDFDIIKLSKDEKRTIIKTSTYDWKPTCVYCCPSTGDLLVGMSSNLRRFYKVIRYHKERHSEQTTGHNQTEFELSHVPSFVTENNNGDVVVSCAKFWDIMDYGVIVVAEREGRHRFTYKGPPCDPKLRPIGICTDPLSNILVCNRDSSIQIVDKNGLFLFYLHTGIIKKPLTVQFDSHSYTLWVGNSKGNTLYNMRYLSRQGKLMYFCFLFV